MTLFTRAMFSPFIGRRYYERQTKTKSHVHLFRFWS